MAIKLEKYNQKRNFSVTEEPEGNIAEPEGKLKFVVQHHAARRDHYDLRLEWEGALLSWAVPKVPSYNTRDKRLAVQVEDHPLDYRNFEGTIPKGEYGGGVVMLWDEGYWEPQMNVEEGLQSGSLKFTLRGSRLKGKWALVRLKPKLGEEKKNNWLLLKERDEYANTSDDLPAATTSIRTGRTMDEIEGGGEEKIIRNPFDELNVQLAKLVTDVPDTTDWLYEMKYDGYRIVAYVEGNKVRLITRNGNDYTNRFSNIAYSLIEWAAGRAMILDGEMAITDKDGKTDFQALQNYMRNPRNQSLTYIVFDLLALDGTDLRGQRLTERKETLKSLMQNCPKNLYYSQHVIGNGEQCFQVACQSNMEGIVGKKVDSVYSGTRNGDWIKLKCDKRQEFVIGGYTLTDKKTSGVSALLLGVYEGENLVYIGRAGTGFSARTMKDLAEKFKQIEREKTPFQQAPEAKKNEVITWLEPELVAEIKFAEWTEENLLRQASFKGLRTDKNPREIKWEEAENDLPVENYLDQGQLPDDREERMKVDDKNSLVIEGIKISSPDKVLFEEPKITKLDVIEYYEAISERMLPFVRNRVLSVVRCPKGVCQACFFKKHPAAESKAIQTIPVVNSHGESEIYFYIQDTAGLIYEAQMGTLEFHTWGSQIDDLEKPDVMVFDLDPDEGMDLETVRQGVRDVREILEQLSLTSFLKTSGGKGYHVVVPFKPMTDWDTFYDFAKRIAVVMEQKWPDRYTSNVRKANRKNKIFIDWIRNGKGATSIAPYSIRAREGAYVSMPIAWEELGAIAPDGIHMAEAINRIKNSDPWKDFFQIDQQLK